MALIRKMTGVGTALALAAVLFGAFAVSANAQISLPFTAFGTGLEEGDEVTASIDGTECGSTEADAAGEWAIQIAADAPCSPGEGDTIEYTLNGEDAAETDTWSQAGRSEGATGLSLTADDGDDDGETPEPAPTGNAGLLGSTGTSLALVLALGVFAAAMVAGGRTVTRRS